MAPLVRLLRPGDWVKNVFVLVPALFYFAGQGREGLRAGIQGAEPDSGILIARLVAVAAAFASFCLLSSGFYAINDALDASHDRLHPVKRLRPVASGALSSRAAIAVGLVCIALSAACAAGTGEDGMAIAAGYAVLQVAYNAGLKRTGIADVCCLAIGFALRAMMGAAAIGVPVSVWLVGCVFFLTLYLACIKRTCDLVAAEREPGCGWRSRAGYATVAELEWLLGISGGMTILAYAMYALSDHAHGIFGARAVGLFLLTPIVLVVVHRFYRRAHAGQSDSPLAALREDGVVRLGIGLFGVLVVAILYVPAVGEWLGRVFAR